MTSNRLCANLFESLLVRTMSTMPQDWSQRLRELSDMPKNRETLARLTESARMPERFRPRPAFPPVPSAEGFDFNSPVTPGVQHDVAFSPPMVAAPLSMPWRPVFVRAASFALLGAATLTLALVFFAVGAVTELRETLDNALKLDKSGAATLLASGYADDAQNALIASAATLGAVCAIVYLVVARGIWKGRHWPRWVSPFLAVLSLPALFLGHLAIVVVFAGLFTAVAYWLPSARTFATQSRAHAVAKRASRRGGAGG